MKKFKCVIMPHWPLWLVVAIYLIVNAPLWRGDGIVAGGDGLLLFYPAEHAAKQALANGRLPFWTPNLQAGFPLLADGQPAAIYPLRLLLLTFLPVPIAHNITILLHGLLALVFTYTWARALQISRPAAALTSLLFVLLTPLSGGNLPMLETLAWLPVLFTATEKIWQTGKPAALWPISLITALQWLAGFPQMALYSIIAASVYFTARLLLEKVDGWQQKVRWLAFWAGALLIGLLLAAPLLWATWELARFSIRANGISGSMAGEKSLFPLALSVFLLPATRSFWGPAGLGGGAYIAIIPFLLAGGAFFRKNKPGWFYPVALMIVTAVILAFGKFSPLFPIIRQLPGLSSFRVPSRFLIFVQFGLLTLFGWQWDRLFTGTAARKKQLRLFQYAIALFTLTSLAGYAVLKLFKPTLINFANRLTFTYIANDKYRLQSEAYYLQKIDTLYQNTLNALWSGAATLIPFMSLLLGWLIIRGQQKGILRKQWAYTGLVILIGLDLFTFTGGFTQTTPLELVTTPPAVAQIIQQNRDSNLCRIYSLTDENTILFREENLNLLPANYNMIWDLPGTGLYSPLGFYDYYRLIKNIGGVNLAFGLKPIPATAVSQNRALLNYLNVCLITSRVELPGFTLAGKANDVYVYKNESFLPRAFAVDEVIVLSDGKDAVTAVLENADQLSTQAILQETIPETLTPNAAENAQITIKEYQDTFVQIEVVTKGAILLQLTDTNYPGWRVLIDNTPAKLLATNGLFRGVIVPQGRHEVTFSYTPVAFRRGLFLAATALFALVVWSGTWFKGHRAT